MGATLKDLYNALKADGRFSEAKDFGTFAKKMNERGYSSMVYNTVRSSGADVPDIATFRKNLGLHVWKQGEGKKNVRVKPTSAVGKAAQSVEQERWGNAINSPSAVAESDMVSASPTGSVPQGRGPLFPMDDSSDDVYYPNLDEKSSALVRGMALSYIADQENKPTSYTKPGALVKMEKSRQKKNGDIFEQTGREYATEEYERQNAPAFSTGANVNDSPMKRQGQLEKELAESASLLANDKSVSDYLSNAIFGEFKNADKQASLITQGMTGAGTPGSEIGLGIARSMLENQQKDPEKLLKNLQEKTKASMATLFSDPNMKAQIEQEAKRLGVPVDYYIQSALAPKLQERLSEDFDKAQLEKYLPKGTTEYVLSGINDSLTGTLIQMATMNKKQREYMQRANAMTAEGLNPNIERPGMWTNAARGAVSFAADAPIFKFLSPIGGAVAAKMFGNAVAQTARVANMSWYGRMGYMAGSAAVNQGTTGLLYGGLNSAVQNYSTGEDTSLANTARVALGGALSEGASWATMGAFGGLVGGGLYKAGLKGNSKNLFWNGAAKVGSDVLKIGSEGVGMHLGGNVANVVRGEDTNWFSVEGVLEDCANVVALKLSHAHKLIGKAAGIGREKGEDGKQESYKAFVLKNLANYFTSDAAKGARFQFTEEEKKELFNAAYTPERNKDAVSYDKDNNAKYRLEGLVHWALRTKNKKPTDRDKAYDDTDTAIKSVYERIMSDENITWDTKSKYNALVMGTAPSVRPMMEYWNVVTDGDKKTIEERAKDGTLLSRTTYDTAEARDAIEFRLRQNKEEQRKNNAYAGLLLKDLDNKDIQEEYMRSLGYDFENPNNPKNKVIEESMAKARADYENGKEDPDSAGNIYEGWIDFAFEHGALKEIEKAFVEEKGISPSDLYKIFPKEPWERTDEEHQIMVDYRRALEKELFPEDTVHEEQAQQTGKDVAEENNLGSETPNNDAVKSTLAELTQAEHGLQELMDSNEVFASEYKRLKEQGLSNAQIYQELINSGMTQEELTPFAKYINANSKAQGMVQGTQQKIEDTASKRVSDWGYNGTLNGEKHSGENMVYVTDDNGRTLVVASGDVAFDSEGNAKEDVGDMLVVYDTATGEMDFVSARDVKFHSTESAEDYKNRFTQHLQELNSQAYVEAQQEQMGENNGKPQKENQHTKTTAEENRIDSAGEIEIGNEKVLLSDEVDDNGKQFVLTREGKLAFGEVEKESNLPSAPILLSEGMITNPSTKDGYGLVHIEARHGDQIRKAGYKSVLDFIENVAKNYEVIKEGNMRDGHRTYRLQLTDKHNNTLMIELSSDGSYWNINTAGIFKTSYGKKNKEVYNRHTTEKQSAETAGTSQNAEQSGTQASSRMKVPTSSLHKDSNSSSEGGENKQTLTFRDGTPVPMTVDSKGRPMADYSKMTAEQGAEWVSSQFGDTAEAVVDGKIERAKKELAKAEKMKVDYSGDEADIMEAESKKSAAMEAAKKGLALYADIKKALVEQKVRATKDAAKNHDGDASENSAGLSRARERFEKGQHVVGNKRTRTLNDGSKLKGHYELVEAESLTPSHDANNGYRKNEDFPVNEEGRTVNDRDYETDKDAQLFTDETARSYNGKALDNVPVVTKDGIVVDGNGRTMAGQKAAKDGTDGVYIESLKEDAENFGFTAEQIGGMKHPRLVFVADDPMSYDTATFAKFNKDDKKSQNNTHQAIANTKKLSSDEVSVIVAEIEGSGSLDAFFNNPSAINNLLKRLIDKGVIGLNEVAGLREGENKLSATGKDFVRNLLLGSVFSEDTIRMMGEDAGLKNKALNGIRAVLDNMKLGEYALGEEIDKAMQLMYEARQMGGSVDALLRTPSMFGENAADKYDPISQAIAIAFDGKAEDFRELMSAYNRNAQHYTEKNQLEMFGERPTKEEFINEFLKLRNWKNYETRHSDKEGAGDAGGTERSEQEARGGNEAETQEQVSEAVKGVALEITKRVGEDLVVTDEGEAEQRLSENGGDESQLKFSKRERPAPKKTQKVYKLMRLGDDGKLYPLFIDSTAPTELGVWYDADSPDLSMLKSVESGVHLVNPKTGEVVSYGDFYTEHPEMFKGKQSKYPSKEALKWAADRGMRFVFIEDTEKGQKRFGGENRKYWNLGLNGSGAVAPFSMRPGWHAGSLPTMRQIGKGKEKNLRDDHFVWVEGEVSADKDYTAEAEQNPDKDLPDRIPEDGYYMKATNADKAKSQADRVGWYVAGAFKANRIMSDREARSVIDKWNEEHPDKPVEYDYERESGREFNAETMSLEDVDSSTPKRMEFRTKDGEVYGFTDGQKIYLDTKKMKPETPLHEYTHLWGTALRRVNAKEWENVKGLLDKVDGLKEEIQKLYPELKGDDLYDEMLAMFSGREGTKKLEDVCRKLAADEGKRVTDSAKEQGFIDKVKTALQTFWKGVADLVHVKFTTAEEVADKVLADWARGYDPREKEEKTDGDKPSEASLSLSTPLNEEGEKQAGGKENTDGTAEGPTVQERRNNLAHKIKESNPKTKAEAMSLLIEAEELAAEYRGVPYEPDRFPKPKNLTIQEIKDKAFDILSKVKDAPVEEATEAQARYLGKLLSEETYGIQGWKKEKDALDGVPLNKRQASWLIDRIQETNDTLAGTNPDQIAADEKAMHDAIDLMRKHHGMKPFDWGDKTPGESKPTIPQEPSSNPMDGIKGASEKYKEEQRKRNGQQKEQTPEEKAAAKLKEQQEHPLTKDEIDTYNTGDAESDEMAKEYAKDYLDGDRNPMAEFYYNEIYDNVRNRQQDGESDSSSPDTPHVDGGIDEAGESRRDGGTAGRVDGGTSGEDVSKGKPSGESGESGTSVLDGEGGDKPVGEGTSTVEGLSTRSRGRRGSGKSGGAGVAGTRRKSASESKGSTGGDKQSAKAAFEESGKEISDIFAKLKKIREANRKNDQGKLNAYPGLASAVVGELAKKMLPRSKEEFALYSQLMKACIKHAYNGLRLFGEKAEAWFNGMKESLHDAVKEVYGDVLSDEDVDNFIKSMWDTKYTIDGKRQTIEQWAVEMGHEKLREALRKPLEQKRKEQQAAEKVEVKVGDAENIAETLPFLLPAQQEDVLKAEKQFFDPSHADDAHGGGRGMMFTNGTGTGKTYTGLGIAKRFIKQGKGRVLIVTPSPAKVNDWSNDAKNLGITLTPLKGEAGKGATMQKGEGAVVTTFANFRQNRALMEDTFDLVIYDESHKLMENKDATESATTLAHYRMTNKDFTSAMERIQMSHPLWREAEQLDKEKPSLIKGYDSADEAAMDPLVPEENVNRAREIEARLKEIDKEKEKILPELTNKAREAVGKTKVVFLSATPFNMRENIEYAEGYLFTYPIPKRPYNISKEEWVKMRQEGKNTFFRQWFPNGERIGAGGKIEPYVSDSDKSDSEERNFADHLMDIGVMSGRTIDNGYDYSRDFPMVSVTHANAFNTAVRELSLNPQLRAACSAVFNNYNVMSVVYETMKVAAAAERIKQHLAMGRKVVIFHRRVNDRMGLARPPFASVLEQAEITASGLAKSGGDGKTEAQRIRNEILKFKEKYKDLLDWEQTLDYRMPREQLASLLGDTHDYTPEEMQARNDAQARLITPLFSGRSDMDPYEAGREFAKSCFDFEDADIVEQYKPHQVTEEEAEMSGEKVTSAAQHKKDMAAWRAVADKVKKGVEDVIRERVQNGELKIELDEKGKKKRKVGLFAGADSKNQKIADMDSFNNDDSGMDVMVVQESSGKEGISLHDTTGKHQRVMINLALPQSPIAFIQAEGRIYRIGQKSNAIFEYPLLGIDNEISLFAGRFNTRAATTENLALGNMARGLKNAIMRGVLAKRGKVPLEGQGYGGRDWDMRDDQRATGYDAAVEDWKNEHNEDQTGTIDDIGTPQPLGFKLVDWAQMSEGEKVLEPSAGEGNVSRYFPSGVKSFSVEPDTNKYNTLMLITGGVPYDSAEASGRRTIVVNRTFEDLSLRSKFDTIVMNSPNGAEGKTAEKHLELAVAHLNDSGRIVAVLPETERMDKFVKSLVDSNPSLHISGEVKLPTCAYSVGGVSQKAKVVVIDMLKREEMRKKWSDTQTIDLSEAKDIDDFFAKLKDVKVPDRVLDPAAKDMQHANNVKTVLSKIKAFNDGKTGYKSQTTIEVGEKGIFISPERKFYRMTYRKNSEYRYKNMFGEDVYPYVFNGSISYKEVKELRPEILTQYLMYSDMAKMSDAEIRQNFFNEYAIKSSDKAKMPSYIDAMRQYGEAMAKMIRGISGRSDAQLRRAAKGEDIDNPVNVKAGTKMTIDDYKALFEANNEDEETGALFEKVYNVAKQLGLDIEVFNDEKTGTSAYYSNANRIRINEAHWNKKKIVNSQGKIVNATKGVRAQVLCHELIHSVTSYANYWYDNAPEYLPDNLREAAKELDDVYNKIMHSKESYKLPTYARENKDELVAEMASPEVREPLKKMGIWTRLVNAVKKFFMGSEKDVAVEGGFAEEKDFEQSTAYNELAKTLDKFLDNFDKGSYDAYVALSGRRNESVHYRTDESLDEVNHKFNERLDSLMKDPTQKGRELQLGRPGQFLKDAGLGDAEIVLDYDRLVRKASEKYRNSHPFSIDDIKNLPMAINNAIAVFDNTNGESRGKVILTELEKDGKNFIVAVRASERHQKGGVVLEVNEIRTLFPKESRGIVNWLNTDKACNINKEKALTWLGALRTHRGTELTEQELSDAAKVVNGFDISKQKAVNYRIGGSSHPQQSASAEHISATIDKVAQQTGGKVKQVNSVEEIENEKVRKDIEDGKEVTGWYDEKTGEVHLYMPNIHDSYTAEKTIWHETVGHKGMRGLLGDKFHAYLRSLWMDMDNPVFEELHKYVKDHMAREPMSMYDAIEEFVAEAAEKGRGEAGFWNNIRNKVADALRSVGYRLCPNVKDVKYMLWLAKNVQKHPNDPVWKMRAEAAKWKIDHEKTEYTTTEGGEIRSVDGKAHGFENMTKAEWDEATDGQVHYRTSPSAATATDRYERMLSKHGYMAIEAFADNMASVERLMRALDPTIKRIEDVSAAMNPYMLRTVLDGTASDKMQRFEADVMQPLDTYMARLIDAVDGKNDKEKIRNFNLYMIKKHGLERNRVFFVRDAVKNMDEKKRKQTLADFNQKRNDLGDQLRKGGLMLSQYYTQLDEWICNNVNKDYKAGEHDYSGMHGMYGIDDKKSPYDDIQVQDEVMSVERAMEGMERGSVEKFWGQLKVATQFSLDEDYKNGFVTKANHESVSEMFDWYVPLRKFDEATAEDVYGYVTELGDSKTAIGPAIVKAKGRKSLSETNILAQVGAMANYAVVRGSQNKLKQAFALFVRNKGGQGLVTETKAWVEKVGTDMNGKDIWQEVFPDIKEGDTADEIAKKVEAFEQDMKQKEAQGLAKNLTDRGDVGFKFERKADKDQHYVDVMIAGKTHRFVINGNPRAAQALNGELENGATTGMIRKTMKSVTRFMAQMATSYNPEFVMRNAVRDAGFALQNVTAKEGIRYAAIYKGYYLKMLPVGAGKISLGNVTGSVGWGLYAKYRNGKLDMNNETEQWFKEFMENGGETGFVQIKNMQQWEKQYKRDILRERSLTAKSAKAVKDFFIGNVECANEVVENMARFAAYCASRRVGRSIQRCAYDAKQVSVNFNRHGSGDAISSFMTPEMGKGKQMRRDIYGFFAGYFRNYSMFFNAGVQGTQLMFSNIKKAPVATIGTMMATPFAFGMAAAMVNAMLIGNEDEKERGGVKDPYAELPEYIRRNNLCIYLGKGKFVTIPLAIEHRAFYGLGDIAASLTTSPRLRNERNVAMDMTGCVSQLFPVVDFMNSAQFDKNMLLEAGKGVLPTTLSPFAEWLMNSDWKGAPIRRVGDYTENRPSWKNAYSSTPERLMELNKWANAATNDIAPGNPNMKGNNLADAITDPSMLNHIIGTLGGGAITTAMRAENAIEKGRDTEWNEIPIGRNFYYTPNERTGMARTKARWYDYVEAANKTMANYDELGNKNVPVDERIANIAARFKFENTDEYRKVDIIKRTQKQLKRMRKLRSRSLDDKAVTDALDEQMNLLIQDAVSRLEEIGK